MSTPLDGLQRSPVTLARAAKLFTPLVVKELHAIEESVGGRAAVVGLLSLAPLTKDLQYVLGILGDPQQQGKSLAECCALANVLPGDLLKHLAAAALVRGKIQAAQRIGSGIPAVIEDIMRRAAPYEEACADCQGTASITPDPTPETPNPVPQPCDTCRGSGRLRYLPTLETQKLAVELAQLLPKSGGLQIAVQQNNHQGSTGGGTMGMGALERLQLATDRVIYEGEGRGRPPGETEEGEDQEVEGEVLPPEDV